MNKTISRRQFHQTGLAVSVPALASSLAAANADPTRQVIRIVVGPSKHPPGTHEVQATGRLLKYALTNLASAYRWENVTVELVNHWPENATDFDNTSSFIFVGDFFPPMRMDNTAKILAEIDRHVANGAGIACIHYATGLGAQDVADDGSHPLLQWIGGYFATRCKHHQSIARVFREAEIKPTDVKHPILQGWKTFTLNDEPYINNYFGPDGPAKNVTILATSDLPPESPKPEPIAWSVESNDGGRGVGVVMPHFFKNWLDPNLRIFLLNAIAWSAKRDIPPEGLQCNLPDLAEFQPDSVEPIPPKNAKS